MNQLNAFDEFMTEADVIALETTRIMQEVILALAAAGLVIVPRDERRSGVSS